MIKLYITRDKSILGSAIPYRVFIDDVEKCKLAFGQTTSFDIQPRQTVLKVEMVGSSFITKKVEKKVTLHPDRCKSDIMTCTISTKINWLGFFSLGLLQPSCMPEIKIEYR